MDSFKKSIVILTGAGISAESGIKTFRDHGGLWENHKVEEVASLEGFWANPELVQRFYNARRLQLLSSDVQPNAAHYALAELEAAWPGEYLLITQNVDNLHERAGSKKMIHMHGELLKVRCMDSERVFEWARTIEPDTTCPCCQKAGKLRPHIVWFGEMPLEMERINEALERCSVFVSIGTSGNVYPAAGFVSQIGPDAESIEINKEPSMVSAAFNENRIGPASIEVPRFVREIMKRSMTCALALLTAAIFANSASAEFDFDPGQMRSPHRISISQKTVPTRDAGDGGGSYGERDFSLKGNFEVRKDFEFKGDPSEAASGGTLSGTKYSVQPQFDRRMLTGLGSMDRDAKINTEGVSFNAFHLAESKEAYFFGLGVSHTGEAGANQASLWIPSAYAIGTHHFNVDTALLYGAAFTTSLGYFIPLPVIGLTSKLSPEWRFTTILPILTEFSWRPVDSWNFAAFLKTSGYETKIANDSTPSGQRFSTSDASVKLKSRAFELGIGAGYDFSKVFSIRGEVAALAARQLKFEDSAGTLWIQKMSAAPVAMSLSASARFGSM